MCEDDSVLAVLCAAPRLGKAPVDVLRICTDFAGPPPLRGHWRSLGQPFKLPLPSCIEQVYTTTDYIVVHRNFFNASTDDYELCVYNYRFRLLRTLRLPNDCELAVYRNQVYVWESHKPALQVLRLSDADSDFQPLDLSPEDRILLRFHNLIGINDGGELILLEWTDLRRRDLHLCVWDAKVKRVLRRFRRYEKGKFITPCAGNLWSISWSPHTGVSTLTRYSETGEPKRHTYPGCSDVFHPVRDLTATRNAELVVLGYSGHLCVLREQKRFDLMAPLYYKWNSAHLSRGDGPVILVYDTKGECILLQ